jgi:phosphonate degradation associated HDIG domain protein
MNASLIADEILDLYNRHGSEDYIGEPVSQIEHMSQCAELAMKQGYEDEVVLAAFFHDIGHMLEHEVEVKHMDGYGVADHEKIGAEYLLSKGFSQRVAALVSSHVDAKRYLTYQYPNYYAALSDASKKTLEFQGGKMTEEEAVTFESQDDFDIYIQLRRWDEAGKLENIPVISLELIREMIVRELGRQHK